LLIAQPKQVVAHDPNPLPKTNQDRIVRAEKLMSSDPSTSPLTDIVVHRRHPDGHHRTTVCDHDYDYDTAAFVVHDQKCPNFLSCVGPQVSGP
jgi:hypothetical protein